MTYPSPFYLYIKYLRLSIPNDHLEGGAAAEEAEHLRLDALQQGQLGPQDLNTRDKVYKQKVGT